MGFDFEISYKKGSDNGAGNALSRVNTGGQLLQMMLTSVSTDLLPKIVECWSTDPILSTMIQNLKDGLLQPLPIPTLIWSDIFMDFVEGLSNSNGKSVIMVVVDRLTKYSHFMALIHPFTAMQVAQVFLDKVYKLHGFPKVIVSDMGKVFLSLFWKELFKMLQVSLHFSSAYHPQTDGQTDVVNRCLECYLRCMTEEKPKEWAKWLSLAEYWYNTNFYTSIKTTPFEVMYAQPPSSPIFYSPGQSNVDIMDRHLTAKEAIIKMLQFHLAKAQARIKAAADLHKTDRSFEVDQWVWLKLQPHRKISVMKGKYNKLLPKYYGPFQVINKVGKVAYKLLLHMTAQIHPVFYVSQLKLFNGDLISVSLVLPQCDPNGSLICIPVKVLERKMVKVNNNMVIYVLVQWSNETIDDVTWEITIELGKKFLDLSFNS
uniref:Retrotransposable element Tf2 n=1 Tax=Tanacetum cinerariifolium TaxID=118510 RepID=A0A6L2LZ82_TANCI|nr:retrotransposable element Tf2 [Tanacetum cinerariifolium]